MWNFPPSFHLSCGSFWLGRGGGQVGGRVRDNLEALMEWKAEAGEQKGEWAGSSSAESLPEPQGPAPPASREPSGPAGHAGPPFPWLACQGCRSQRIRRGDGAPGPGGRPRMRWSPRRGTGRPRAPATPVGEKLALLCPEPPWGRDAPYPRLRPRSAQCLPCRGRVRRGRSREPRLQDQPGAPPGEDRAFPPGRPGRGSWRAVCRVNDATVARGPGARAANTPPPPPPTSLIVKETGT